MNAIYAILVMNTQYRTEQMIQCQNEDNHMYIDQLS